MTKSMLAVADLFSVRSARSIGPGEANPDAIQGGERPFRRDRCYRIIPCDVQRNASKRLAGSR